MPLMVDANNVMHTTGVLPREQALGSVDDLVELIRLGRYGREAVELIFDSGRSPPPDSQVGLVRVRYTGPGVSADEVIAAAIRPMANPGSVIVVSSDRAVLRDARKRGCRRLRSEQFLTHLAEDAAAAMRARPRLRRQAVRPLGPLSPQAVQAWLQAFGLNEAELEELLDDEPDATEAERSEKKIEPDGANSESQERQLDRELRRIVAEEMGLPPQIIDEAQRLWTEDRRD